MPFFFMCAFSSCQAETSEDLFEWKTALENALAQAPNAALVMGHNGIFRSDTNDTIDGSFHQCLYFFIVHYRSSLKYWLICLSVFVFTCICTSMCTHRQIHTCILIYLGLHILWYHKNSCGSSREG